MPPPRRDSHVPAAALVEAELQRIEASTAFRRSPRHRTLLRHLVRYVLAGDPARLKESILAADVFGRDLARFDPRADTTVRVEVRRLRQKLDRYYATEGADAHLRIHVSAGSYVPWFEDRNDAASAFAAFPAVAVLPFVNLTGAAEHDVHCDALTEELIDALVQVPGLKVVARTSVFAFKGRTEDLRDVGRELGVRALVEGSVQRHAGRFRIVAQLIDAADGMHLWSRAYETEAAVPAAAALLLARAVADGLDLARTSAGALRRAERRISTHAEARDCWQRGKYLLGRHTATAYRDAVKLFQRATAADPKFALAWAGIAQGAIGLIGLASTPDPTTIGLAREALARAIDLDPDLAPARAGEAFLAFAIDRDFAAAERASLTALRYAPGSAYVHHNHAWMLTMAGRFDEAEEMFARARELDPFDPGVRVHQALLWFYRRDYAQAEDHFARVLDVEPDNIVARVLLASARLNAGALAAAREDFERVSADWPADSIGPLGLIQVLAMEGRKREAEAALAAMVDRLGRARIGPYRLAIAHARLDDADAAYAALDDAAATRDMNLVCLAVDPSFDGLRGLPTWPLTLARYGLRAAAQQEPSGN